MTVSGQRAARLEYRLTRPNASLADLDAALALASEHDIAGIVVSPWLVKAARRLLGRSPLRVGTVVGYPHGGQLLVVKAFEASKSLEQGATQIDFVMNGGALISGADETVHNDMLAVVDMAHSALARVGVIIEAEPLRDDLVSRACRLAERAGADYVVTSTGFATARRTIERVSLLRDSVGPRLEVKASGRFGSADELSLASNAGAASICAELNAEMLVGAPGAMHAMAAR